MLSKSFKPAKCKTSLKLAVARMKLLKNKRDIQLKQMKRDLAQLLDSGQEQTARIRVEHVVREEKTMAAYEIIELYCELIVARLPIIESQKNCPIDLKEAIASVIFAAPRCADVPELQDIRKHLTAKYGKDFAAAALELRPDCGVSRMVVEKLSATTPDGETKIKILTAIAKDHNVNWDPQALREEIAKPAEDLLKVPSRPENSAKTFVESSNELYHNSEDQFKFSNEQFLARPGQKLDPSSTFAGSDGIKSSPGPSTFSSLDSKLPSFSVHSSYSREGFSESKVASKDSKSSTYVGDSKSADGENWNMRFKDATSAAQAAAESAELASLAARAAAELSSRGKLTNDHSRTVTDSPYDMTKDEVSPSTSNPKSSSTRSSFKKNGDPEVYHAEEISKRSDQQRDETYWSNHSDGSENRYDAMQNKSSSLKKSGISSPAGMLSNDEISPTTRNSKSSSTRSSFKKSGDPEVYHVEEILKKNDQERDETSWYNLSHSDESRSDVMRSRNSSVREAALSQPADMFSNDDAPVIDLLKAGGSFMDTGSGSNRNDIGSPHSTMNFVRMNSSPRPDIKDYDSDIFGEDSRGTFGESSYDRRSKRLSNDYFAAVFDDSGSESEEKLDLEDVNGTGRFPAHISTDEGYSLSHSGSWNFNEQNASPLANNSTDNSHIMGPKHTTENSVESLKNSDQSQKSDLPAATFDDSDGDLSSSSDGEVDILKLEERNKSGSYSYTLDRSDRLTLSAGSVHEPIKSEDENRHFKEVHRNLHGPYSYDDSDSKNNAVDVGFKQDLAKPLQKHDSGNILRERPHFEDTKGIDNLAVEEHQMTSLPSPSAGKTFDMLGVDLHDKISDEVEVLNFSSDENEMRLNFGRLTGGLRHKNFIQPPYVKHPSKQRTTYNTSVESQSVDFGGRRLKSSKAPSMELPSEKSHEEVVRETKEETAYKTLVESQAIDFGGRRLKSSKAPSMELPSEKSHEVVRETKQETAYKTLVESQAVDFGGRTPKYSEATVAQLSRENSPKEVNEESKQGAIDKTFVESQTINFGGRTPRNTKAPVLELPSEKSREDIVKEPKHKKAFDFFDSDSSDDDKKQEPQKTVNSKAYNDNAFSRRTKALPSKTEAGSTLTFTSHIRTQRENSGEASSTSDRKTNVVRSKGRGIRSTEGIFSVKQSSKPPSSEDPSLMAKERINPQPKIPKREAPKSSKLSSLIGESSSVDNSPKLTGHVHPKLPEYDTLAARIQSLTSNKR